MITQSSTTKWTDFEETIAKVLNIFTSNLRAQYVLSTEPTSTIPIGLTSEDDLAELHTRLIPLVVPPRNANGSKSKRKMKEFTVKITDKNDDVTSSKTSTVGHGKVRNRYIFGSITQGIILQKKNEVISSNSSDSGIAERNKKKVVIREAIKAHWRCETHSTGDESVPCWRDGITTQCYVIREGDLTFWADLYVRGPNML